MYRAIFFTLLIQRYAACEGVTPTLVLGVGLEGTGHNALEQLLAPANLPGFNVEKLLLAAHDTITELKTPLIYSSPSWPYERPARYLKLTRLILQLKRLPIKTKLLLITRNFNTTNWFHMPKPHPGMDYEEHMKYTRKMLEDIHAGLLLNKKYQHFEVAQIRYDRLLDTTFFCAEKLSKWMNISVDSMNTGAILHRELPFFNDPLQTEILGSESNWPLIYNASFIC
jgi:hypothetical protein